MTRPGHRPRPAAQTLRAAATGTGLLLASLMVIRLYLPPFRPCLRISRAGPEGTPRRLLRWSFSQSFHQGLLQPTRPHSTECLPNLSCPDPTGAVWAEDGQLSPKQQVAGSSPARGTGHPSPQVRRLERLGAGVVTATPRGCTARGCTALDDPNIASWLDSRLLSRLTRSGLPGPFSRRCLIQSGPGARFVASWLQVH